MGLQLELAADTAQLQVNGDPTRIRQILLNLIGNALKFTEHGHVQVQARWQALDDQLIWLTCDVRDTGIGIAPDDIARLFENFRQVSAATAQNYGGTGLGLALSQKLCTLMGGSIGVTSEPERGSVFSFCIPAEVAEAPAETTPPIHASAPAALVPALGVRF